MTRSWRMGLYLTVSSELNRRVRAFGFGRFNAVYPLIRPESGRQHRARGCWTAGRQGFLRGREGAYARTRRRTARWTADATLSTNRIAGDNRAFRSIYGFDTRPGTDWTGRFSSDWFLSGNWTAGFPRQTTDGKINTVTPNSTVIASPGAQAQNLSVGQTGTGMLVIQNGGTLADCFGTVGNLPGGQGTVTVTGAGSTWTNAGTVVVGGLGTGTLTIQDGGTVNSSGGGSVGLSAGSTGTVTVTGPGSSWINGPGGGLNIGSFGTGTLTIANGGKVINITPSPPTSAMVQARMAR